MSLGDRVWVDWGRPPGPPLKLPLVRGNCDYVARGIDVPDCRPLFRRSTSPNSTNSRPTNPNLKLNPNPTNPNPNLRNSVLSD